MKKKKIIVNEDLQSIFNNISTNENVVTWSDIVQYASDYNIYEQLYLNHFIVNYLLIEHNDQVRSGSYVKSN